MQTTRSFAIRIAMAIILCGSFLLFGWGCGRKMGATVQVRGKVTLDGQPFSQGSIWFSSARSGAGFRGRLLSDGTYSVSLLDVRPGDTYGVFIGGVEPDDANQGDSSGNPVGITVPPVPAKYRESATSGLTATLDQAKPRSFDFELKSK